MTEYKVNGASGKYMNLVAKKHFNEWFFFKCSHYIRNILNLCLLGNFACFFVVCRSFFIINFLEEKIFQKYHQCQTVWIQIRPDVLSGLIWVQLFAKVINRQKVSKKLRNLLIGSSQMERECNQLCTSIKKTCILTNFPVLL